MLFDKLRAEKERQRYAYEAICALVDSVSESDLQRHLSVLDPNAWCEVVEERFLGRLCGFPLCDMQLINVDFRKKYTIVRRRNETAGKEEKMIVPTDSEPVKFCSDQCMGKWRAIAAQLAEQRKQFSIPNDKSQWMPFLTTDNTVQKAKFGVELVTKLNDLKLADEADQTEEKDKGKAEGSNETEATKR